MSNFDALKNIVRAVAPGIATALGGPAAGIAVASLSNLLLGKPNGSPEEIEGAIASASPETLIKLKELDLQCQQMQFQEYQNARQREVDFVKATGKHDWIMGYLVIFTTIMYLCICFLSAEIPDTIEPELHTQLYGFLGLVFGFYFGNNKK